MTALVGSATLMIVFCALAINRRFWSKSFMPILKLTLLVIACLFAHSVHAEETVLTVHHREIAGISQFSCRLEPTDSTL